MTKEESPKMSGSDPKLRHEFVGMMFAITIGEVGLQAAALVQAQHFLHFLHAYTHLIVATVMIATSWVGWSVSRAPGARLDVTAIFQWEFVILLLDVALVITYFILVRTVDFGKESSRPRVEPPSILAFWMLIIFGLYFAWDVVTKVVLRKQEGSWFRNYGSRMLPTVICFFLALIIKQTTINADLPHYLTADVALLSVVLLFRALKDLVSALIPKEAVEMDSKKVQRASFWTVLCFAGFIFGLFATTCSWAWPIPDRVTREIQTPISSENNGTTEQP